MLTQTRKKPRFQLDVPKPPQRWTVPSGGNITVRRKRPLFRVGPKETSRRGAQSAQALTSWLFSRWAPLTLAQRRQRRRLTWIASGALVVIVALVGVLAFAPPAHTQGEGPATADTSPIDGGGEQMLHFRSAAPFAALQGYTAANAGQPPAIQAKAAFLFDPQHGWIFYQKNPDASRPAASLTKIMTLLLATNSGLLDQVVTIGPDAAALVNSNNSYMGVSVGEQLSLRQLLYGLMLPGGNDAALAIADAVSGGEPAFVAMMNLYALQLGLDQTHFVSADGVSSANISSARDLAILTAIAIQQPGVAQITATRYLAIPQTSMHKSFHLWNTNDLLSGASSAYPGVNGLKAGYTSGAGYCMAFSVIQNGHLIVGVILGDPSDQARVSDARALLDWGFAQES